MRVFLGIGANLGDPKKTISRAWDFIGLLPQIRKVASSRCYITKPVSDIPQPDFINCVWQIETSYHETMLMAVLQAMELKFGKQPSPSVPKNAPRLLDIDILFFGEKIINTPGLEIPHPRLYRRAFVLLPLADLTETLPVPCEGEASLKNLIAKLPEESIKDVKAIHEWRLL